MPFGAALAVAAAVAVVIAVAETRDLVLLCQQGNSLSGVSTVVYYDNHGRTPTIHKSQGHHMGGT